MTPQSVLRVDGEHIDTYRLYADTPVVRYELTLSNGRRVIRTADQIAHENVEDYDGGNVVQCIACCLAIVGGFAYVAGSWLGLW